ncbi:MAG: hypothetical protein CMD92_01025 [Gammaproteobacteria bacterium]|nr:hypothetical protein [Gammaproteobacteria bacterium]HBW84133.1 hypothetical protein [Gammaproteobacteria bacterium]
MRSVKYLAVILVLLQQIYSAVNAQDGDPCGPASVLSGEVAINVAEDSRCFELRFYTADPAVDGSGGVDDLHQRFREKQQELLTMHGAELIGYWQRLDNPNTIVWLLAFRDRAHRDEVFSNFRADPEWLALREKYNVPVQRELFFMSATDYSALK